MPETKLLVYSDGGARGNPGPAAYGFLIKDQDQQVIHEFKAFMGNNTNNQAEYQGVLNALQWLLNNPTQASEAICHLDSLLVVNQLSGKFKIKQPGLIKLAQQTHKIISALPYPITFTYIPRAQNHEADALVNQALDAALL